MRVIYPTPGPCHQSYTSSGYASCMCCVVFQRCRRSCAAKVAARSADGGAITSLWGGSAPPSSPALNAPPIFGARAFGRGRECSSLLGGNNTSFWDRSAPPSSLTLNDPQSLGWEPLERGTRVLLGRYATPRVHRLKRTFGRGSHMLLGS
jgi:hypothetical protein